MRLGQYISKYIFVLGVMLHTLGALALSPSLSPCEVIRGAVDLGSGTTKIKVAKVNKCQKIIGKVLYEKNIKVSYQADLDQHQANTFSKTILMEGERAIRETILEIARSVIGHDKIEWKGIARAAFRTATNANSFVQDLNKKYPMNIRIFNQVEEAILGYHAAFVYDLAPEKAVVWDIGGGSSQWTTQVKGEYHFYLSELASETFKERIIKEIKKTPLLKTPNPIYADQRKLAEAMILAEVSKMNPKLKETLQQGAKVVGIGSVHFYSIIGQIYGLKNPGKKFYYTLDQVETVIQGRLGQTDKQIGGDYAATDVSNLIYAAAFMKALGIKSIVARNINLNDGLLLNF
jgi:exopolyphosphatase/guanosine-5'-triphosphate,3'-diphosphate pyrophosphatase